MKTLIKDWYRPRDIASLGLIRNSTGGDNEESNYIFILRLIANGQLRAKNFSHGTKRPSYLISKEEIKRYHDTVDEVGE